MKIHSSSAMEKKLTKSTLAAERAAMLREFENEKNALRQGKKDHRSFEVELLENIGR